MLKDIIKAALTVAAISTGMAAFTGAIAAAGITAKAYFMRQFVAYTALIGLNAITAKGTNNTSRKNLGIKQAGLNSIAARNIVYGKNRVGGTIVFRSTSGTNNSKLHNLIALAGHEINDLKKIFIDGGKGLVELDLTSDFSTVTKNGETVHRVTNTAFINTDNPQAYSGGALIELTFEKGDQTTANGYVKDQIGFTNDHKLQGIAYVYINCIFDTEKFASYPNFSFEVEGKKVYDPVTATTVYSTNPALIIRDYLMDSTYGFGAISDEINDATTGAGFVKARSDCNDSVTITGGTESRYTLNGQFDSTEEPQQVLQHMLSACAGQLLYNNGKFSLFVGKERTASGTITDDKLLAPISITTKASGQDLANGVKASYVRPSDNYIAGEITPYQDSTYLSADTPSGQQSADYENYMDLSFPFTQSTFTAQRLARIALDYQRQDQTLTAIVPLEFMTHQVGDIINFTNDRLGYSGKDFEIVAMGFEFIGDNYLALRLNLKEYSSTVFNNITYVADPTLPSAPSAGDNTVGTPTGLTLTESSKNTTAKEIYIQASWTNDDDDKIVATEVAFKKSTDSDFSSNYTSYPRTAFTFRAESSTTYNFKVRHISSTGVAGGYTSVVNITTSADVGTFTDGTIAGITVETDKIYEGTGTFNNSNTGFYLDDQGQFSLKDKLSFDGTTLDISGNLTVENTITADKIVVDGINLDNLISASTQSGSIYLTEFTGIKIATSGSGSGYPPLLKLQDDTATDAFTDITQSQTGINIRARAGTNKGTITFQGIDSGITPSTYASFNSSGDMTFNNDVIISGDLTVNGTTVTLNTATLDVEDKNITLNYGAGDTSASANGAGITIQDAVNSTTDATILWDATNDEFDFSHGLNISGNSTFNNTVTVEGTTTFNDDVSFTNDALFGDNDKAIFGAGSDLQIYHDGSNSFVKDAGTGLLYLLGGSGIVMQNPSQTETFLTATVNNKVELYFDNSPKLATTSTGVQITGTTSSGQLTVTTSSADLAVFRDNTDHDVGIVLEKNPTSDLALMRLNGTNGDGRYIIGYGATHSNNANQIAIKNLVSNGQFFYQNNGGVIWTTGNQGFNLKVGSYEINGVDVITSARNLENIGTISSGAITSSGTITAGSGGSASSPIITFSGDTDTGIYRTAANQLAFTTASTQALKLDGSQNATFAGNVSVSNGALKVGTVNSISGSMDIYGGSAGVEGGEIRLHTTNGYDTTYEWYRIDAYQDDLRIGRAGNTDITLDSSGNTTFAGTISSGGNPVVLGGVSNAVNLTITGVMQANNGYKVGSITVIDSSRNLTNIGTISSGKHDITANGLSDKHINLIDSANSSVTGAIYHDNGLLSIESNNNTAAGEILFKRRTSTTTVENARFDSSGNQILGSSGSARTTGGTAKLSVEASSVALNVGASNNDCLYVRRIATGDYQFQTYNGGNDGEIQLQPYGGRVGIGTTSPSEKLHISGTNSALRIDGGTSYTNTSAIILSNGRTKIDSEIIDGTAQGDTAIKFSNRVSGTLAERMRIDHFGRMLLGKTSADNTSVGFRFDSASGFASFVRDGGEPLYLNRKTSDGDVVKIAKDGTVVGVIGTQNWGIGTASPATLLHLSANDPTITLDDSGTSSTITGQSGNILYKTSSTNRDHIFFGVNNEKFRVTGDGLLQVGSSQTTILDAARNLINIASLNLNGKGTATSIPKTFPIANTGNNQNRYIKFGTISSIGQSGRTVKITVSANSGYNASDAQNTETIIRFKTSNNSSNQSGFYGDCQQYRYGDNTAAPSDVLVKQVSSTQFEFYGLFSSYTGEGSIYTVEHNSGTWTHDGTDTGATAPSGTVLTATKRSIFTSGTNNATFAGNITANGGTLTASSTGGATLTLEDSGSHLFRIVTENNVNSLNFKEGGNNTIMSLEGSNRRVGIGTGSPDERLHIVGQASLENAGNTNRGNLILGPHGSGTEKWSTLAGTHYNDATGSGNGTGAAGNMIIGCHATSGGNEVYIGGGPYELNPATAIRFNTHGTNLHGLGGSERMRIDSSGRVGIGTTSPAAVLHVIGDQKLFGNLLLDTGVNGFRFLGMNTSDGADNESLYLCGGGNASPARGALVGVLGNEFSGRGGELVLQGGRVSTGNIVFSTGTTTTERMRISSSGNVGIGTDSPDLKLHVAHSDSNNGLLLEHTAQASGYQYVLNARQTEGLIFQRWANGSFSSNTMTLDYNNRVGIGTTSPATDLHISKSTSPTLRVERTGASQLDIIASTASAGSIIDAQSNHLTIRTSTAEHIEFETNDTERMRINSSGGIMLNKATAGNNTFGLIQNHDSFHEIVIRGYPTNNSTGYSQSNVTSFSQFGGDFRFYLKDNNNLILNQQFTTSGIDTKVGGFLINGIAVIDSSRNLTNIGTISSTDFTTNGAAVVVQNKNLTVLNQPVNISSPNNSRIKFFQTTSSTTATKGSIQWFDSNSNACGSIRVVANGSEDNSGFMEFYVTSETDEITDPFGINKVMTIADDGVTVHGSLSKSSGSFKIDHPLKPETHDLVHSFVESPQADNIYSGEIELIDGRAEINLDAEFNMTEGTIVALNRGFRTFTTNETDWDNVKGSVADNILTIVCQNPESTAKVSWLVIGERQDQHMYDTDWTDDNGKVIVEPVKVG